MTRRYSDWVLYRRLLDQARPFWAHILLFALLSVLASPLALLTPLPMKIAVDSIIGTEPLPRFFHAALPGAALAGKGPLIALIALSLAIALLTQVQSLATTLLRTYTGEKLARDFRARLFRHVQRLSLAYHDSVGTADSTYRIYSDASSIQYVAIDGVVPFVSAACTVTAMIWVTAGIDWQLAMVALAVAPILLLVSKFHRPRLRRRASEVKRLESTAYSLVQETLGAVRVVKAFAQEDRHHQRFIRQSSEGLRANLLLSVVEGRFGLLLGLTTAVGTAAALFFGIQHVQQGLLTLGQLLLVMGYLAQLYAPLRTISHKAAALQSHLASAERAFTLLDETPDVMERAGARSLERAVGAVTFKNVSFTYANHSPVLQDISFHVESGTRLGIVGTTGAGKTTLVSLLTRFYDPTVGQILLDGVDLRDYKLTDVRNQFAIVLQEPVLFSTSIAENISYARAGATEEEIISAAKAAYAHEFIVQLPDGYNTPVGERGMKLSGGERQRISLARAFLKNAPILILDEPTSSVDLQTESFIIEAMERLMRDRTSFIIAHRLSTLRDCDLLLHIEKGRVVEANNTRSMHPVARVGAMSPQT